MTGNAIRGAVFAAFLFSPLCCSATFAQVVLWDRQSGIALPDVARGVSVDSLGNVFVGGTTAGVMTGTNAGSYDAYLQKLDTSGNVVWTQQFGSSGSDGVVGLSADGLGNVYATGYALGDLGGSGQGTIFVTKYDSNGNRLWLRQLGIFSTSAAESISADHLGNVYISGFTNTNELAPAIQYPYNDALVIKYDSNGNKLWTRLVGSGPDDESYAVATDTLGNVFVGGYTEGNLARTNPITGYKDAIITKINSAGTQQWTRQFGGTTDDIIYGMATDNAGDVYATGYTQGDLAGTNAGPFDAFLVKYDTNGNSLWARQLGTSTDDESYSVSTDALGFVYIAGMSDGGLGGASHGGRDGFILKYDASGNLIWKRQYGSAEDDQFNSVAADGLGNVYVAGDTGGQAYSVPRNEVDSQLLKIGVPEPAAWLLMAIGGFALSIARAR